MDRPAPHPPFAWRSALVLAGAKLVLHGALAARYGLFRDELYFLDCARHPMWGYVDDAPAIAWLAKLALLLGGSLPAVRILAALAGAGTVLLACLLAREFGGRRFAQVLAGLCVLAAPVFLVEHGLLCVGAFEPLVWLGCVLLLLRIQATGDGRLWLAFGALAGLGVLLKYTMGLVLICMLAGMACTSLRRWLGHRLLWAGAAVAVALFLPTLLWQIRNHWPLLVDLATIRRTHKNVELPPLPFLASQVMMVQPLIALIWIPGLVRLLRRGAFRAPGLFYLFLLGAMMLLRAKDYYLAAAYPLLFAAGAAAWEEALEAWAWTRGSRWPKPVGAGLVAAMVLIGIPPFTPLLAPERLHALHARLGLHENPENSHGPLLQPFSDQFGWRELAQETASIYQALPSETRAVTGIWTANYGEAGAIDWYGPSLGLPPAVCGHNACSFWSFPSKAPTAFIVLGFNRRFLEQGFRSVVQVGSHHHPWGMALENQPIFLCRELNRPFPELWKKTIFWN